MYLQEIEVKSMRQIRFWISIIKILISYYLNISVPTQYRVSKKHLFQSDAACTRPIKKGLLWQQKDKFFSRWKERFIILTEDYLQCFKKENSRVSEMGTFILKVFFYPPPKKFCHFYIAAKAV